MLTKEQAVYLILGGFLVFLIGVGVLVFGMSPHSVRETSFVVMGLIPGGFVLIVAGLFVTFSRNSSMYQTSL
jgi:hypothetical protein